MLSPYPITLKSFRDFNRMAEKRHKEIASPDQPDEHPNILEIRKRLIEFIHELDERDLFRSKRG